MKVVPCFIFILFVFVHYEPGFGYDDTERKLKPPPLIPRPPTTHAPWPPLPTLQPSTPCPPLPSSPPLTTDAPPVTGPPGLCPFPDPKCAVHLPHPDPTKFYKCAHGVAFVKQCQPPLKFDATSQICDW